MKYSTSYQYSLLESVRSDTWNASHPNEISATNYNDLYNIVVLRLKWGLTTDLQSILKDPIVTKLFFNYILANNLLEMVAISEEEITDSQLYEESTYNKVFGEFWRLFLARLEETFPRYKTLIDMYEKNEQSLLNKVKNTSTTIFNDTPQSKEDFTTNEFATNISKYEGESDIAPLMSRLEEIREKWDNLYKEWYHSFDELFMEDN